MGSDPAGAYAGNGIVSLLPHRTDWTELQRDAVTMLECHIANRGTWRRGDVERLGPSHRSWNGRGGWEKMVGQNGNGAFIEETPCRWSRRWFNEPPVGTKVFLGDGLVEVPSGEGFGRRSRPSPTQQRPELAVSDC